MTGLRELLDAATPGPWVTNPEYDDDDPGALHNVWRGPGGGYLGLAYDIAQAEDARLMALAPDLAALCLDMGEALKQIAYTTPANNAQGNLNIFREMAAVTLARLDRIGKEEA